MSPNQSTTLLIIGGGPGGYVAAIRAGQLGIPTVLIEGQALGGTCLNIGCVPSKALIHTADTYYASKHSEALGIPPSTGSLDIIKAIGWKDGIVDRLTTGVAALLKKNGVNVIHGWAKIVDGKAVEVDGQRIECEHLLLATGSTVVELPSLPFGPGVISSTEALAPSSLPKRLAIIGAGYIGLELGTAYRKLGVEVIVLEAQGRILPAYDAELTNPVSQSLKSLGIDVFLQHKVESFDAATRELKARNGQDEIVGFEVDQVLVAVGRRPNTQGWNLEALDLSRHGHAIAIDNQCRTSMSNVWAIGDLTGEPMLAHRAMAQGEMVAEIIAGKNRHFQPAAIPAVCFTDPEIVVAGLSPEQAKAHGIEIISASFPFAANGRAMTLETRSGFVRVVARADDHLILGWQAVGTQVSELSAAFGHSLEMSARLEDIAGTVHAHPTLGEAMQEAALKALGHALHI